MRSWLNWKFELKKAVTYFLLIVFSLVNNDETIQYLSSDKSEIIVSRIADFDCENENSEQDEQGENKIDTDLSDDFILSHRVLVCAPDLGVYFFNENCIFSTSDYNQIVFSPPEIV